MYMDVYGGMIVGTRFGRFLEDDWRRIGDRTSLRSSPGRDSTFRIASSSPWRAFIVAGSVGYTGYIGVRRVRRVRETALTASTPFNGVARKVPFSEPACVQAIDFTSRFPPRQLEARGIWARILELDIWTTKIEFRACDLTPGGSKKRSYQFLMRWMDADGCGYLWILDGISDI